MLQNNGTQTEVKDNQSDNPIIKAINEPTINIDKLMLYINSCTRDFLDELVLTFNDKEVLENYQYAHSTKVKQNTIYKALMKNPPHVALSFLLPLNSLFESKCR